VNRALRAATMGVLLVSPVALSACSAGQVTQTATQERDKTGGQAQVGDLTLRQAELESPRGGAYDAGDDPELRLAIVNPGTEDDTLVAIEGDGFAEAEVRSTPAAGTPTTTPTPTPTTTATPTTGAGAGTGTEIPVPAESTVYIGEDVRVVLTDLEEPLTTGQYLDLDLTFENAGEVRLQVTVANPDDEQDRGDAFDFHQEEGAEEQSAE
jgi:copper(I)-binding protein